MSKTTENVLLVPGESGWEIWTGQSDAGLTLHTATTVTRAGEIAPLPAGDLTMFFPVKSFTAVAMQVNSENDALFPDLAALHAERLGLRPDPMAGQLTDLFVISREKENTSLLAVFLRTPADGDLPIKSPKGFDISARAFPVTNDQLVVWKEFGRWVFATFHQGNLVFCQATSADDVQPTEALAREIRLSLMQLSMQGLDVRPSRVVIWSNSTTIDSSAFAAAFTVPVEVTPRPVPVLPESLSKLLPADVRAARRAARRKLNIILGIAAAVVVYLGIIGWFAYGLWQSSSETKRLNAKADAVAPDREAYQQHIARWDELSHVIDINNSPVDILSRISSCIPPNSGLRLKIADISSTEIRLTGEAPKLEAVNTFSLKLQKNNDLANFAWQTPEPNQSTRGWEFVFTAEVPVTQSQP